MLDPRPEVDRIQDTDMHNVLKNIFDSAFGNPIAFSSAPSLSDMDGNTWGFYSTDLYIKFNDDTGIKISGTAMT